MFISNIIHWFSIGIKLAYAIIQMFINAHWKIGRHKRDTDDSKTQAH